MQFRYDINFLRAIAVIAVVLFHFNPEIAAGGFAGVDVFFVISGYLMTGIIFRGLKVNNFSLINFYIARINRIIPALAFLCLVLIIFGYFYLTYIDYKVLSKHIASSITFLSNIIYSRESGYFDSSTISKWLIHTWSLSIEWQFYILYPILVLLLKKIFSLNSIKKIIVLFSIISFFFSIFMSSRYPSASYYFLPSRAWEMTFGALVYLYPFNIKQKRIASNLGVFLIILSVLIIPTNSLWPSYLTLLPVLSTCIVIASNHQNSFLFKNILSQCIGKWSYSIYLWHWPLVVYGYYQQIGSSWVYIGLPLSVLLGFLSHKYIEKYKFNKEINWKNIFFVKPILFSIIILISSLFIYSSSITFRESEQSAKNLSAIEAINDWSYPEPNLFIDNLGIRYIKGSSEKNILFIGASHIEQLYPYVLENHGYYNVYFLTKGGCLPTPSMKHSKWSCDNIQNYSHLLRTVHFDKIVTSLYCLTCELPKNHDDKEIELKIRIKEYDDFLSRLKEHTKHIYLLLGEPQGKEFDPVESLRFNLPHKIKTIDVRHKYKEQAVALSALKELNDVKIIDPIPYLCDNYCNVMDSNNNYFYKDDNHMRPWYAKRYLTYLSSIFVN
ncbi:acyltransferase family protein [Providencia rettgeri]|nr:acyltransferase [Providencia rettgeri]